MLWNKELHPDRTAKALLIMSGIKARDLAKQLNRSEAWLSLVINNRLRSTRARKMIARAVGLPVTDMWPEEGLKKKAA